MPAVTIRREHDHLPDDKIAGWSLPRLTFDCHPEEWLRLQHPVSHDWFWIAARSLYWRGVFEEHHASIASKAQCVRIATTPKLWALLPPPGSRQDRIYGCFFGLLRRTATNKGTDGDEKPDREVANEIPLQV
jgi:hypothetical protein